MGNLLLSSNNILVAKFYALFLVLVIEPLFIKTKNITREEFS